MARGVENHSLDTTIFTIRIEWYHPITKYFKKRYFEDDIPKEKSS